MAFHDSFCPPSSPDLESTTDIITATDATITGEVWMKKACKDAITIIENTKNL